MRTIWLLIYVSCWGPPDWSCDMLASNTYNTFRECRVERKFYVLQNRSTQAAGIDVHGRAWCVPIDQDESGKILVGWWWERLDG